MPTLVCPGGWREEDELLPSVEPSSIWVRAAATARANRRCARVERGVFNERVRERLPPVLCAGFAAPEVLSGGPYNHAADWWSLGILLFSLVTGKVRSLLLLS